MKYLILGNGFIGNKFSEYFKGSITSNARINSKSDALEEIEKYSPDVVINCIGKTGTPNVDWCEDHKSETLFSNTLVPVFIAEACEEKGVKMVQIGSGCVYQGDKDGQGFSEEDEPNHFDSFYSRTKIYSEELLKNFSNVLQIRIRMPVSGDLSPRNLISKLIRYDKIINVDNSVCVFDDDFMNVIKRLIEMKENGIFNVVNKNPVKHEEIMKLFEEISEKKLNYSLIGIEELNRMTTKAKRSNCVLSVKKLESLGIDVPETIPSLKKAIQGFIKKQEASKK